MRKETHITKNYLVDEDGNIYNAKTGHKKSLYINRDGYQVLDIYENNKATRYTVHRIVAIAFIPNPENKPCVNHIDGDKTNNKVTNLEWATYSENNKHAFEAGLSTPKRGELNGRADMTDATANRVCKMIEEGYRNKEISETLNISRSVVKQVRSGKTWKHISCNYKLQAPGVATSESTVRWICRMLQQGYRNRDIVRMATSRSVTKDLVTRIRCRRAFAKISCEYNF